MKTSSFIEKWKGVQFESSSQTTPQLREFLTELRRYIVDMIKPDFSLSNFSRGHFECSGFLQHLKTGKFIYFSISDVRYSQDEWINNILIRTAKDSKDYTGGSNNYCELTDLRKATLNLLQI